MVDLRQDLAAHIHPLRLCSEEELLLVTAVVNDNLLKDDGWVERRDGYGVEIVRSLSDRQWNYALYYTTSYGWIVDRVAVFRFLVEITIEVHFHGFSTVKAHCILVSIWILKGEC